VVVGDPTEGALIVAASKAGLTQQALEQEMPRLDTIPFESDFQYMATLHKKDQLIYVKGSTEPSSNGALRGSIQRDAWYLWTALRWSGQMQWQSRVTRTAFAKSQ